MQNEKRSKGEASRKKERAKLIMPNIKISKMVGYQEPNV